MKRTLIVGLIAITAAVAALSTTAEVRSSSPASASTTRVHATLTAATTGPRYVAPVVGIASAPASCTSGCNGYDVTDTAGSIFAFGDSQAAGSLRGTALSQPIVGVSTTPDNKGYWLVASDGGVFAFGDAAFYGSAGNIHLNRPIVGLTATPDGKGYWLVASDGGVFSFGDASFYGSTGGINLTKPVVGIASAPGGKGYWLVASDGGVFSYGNAQFYGSTGDINLTKPVVGIASAPGGKGYWLVASDGGIFSFGNAPFLGSAGGITLNRPIVGMAANNTGTGYWLVATDGGIFSYGAASFLGSVLPPAPLPDPAFLRVAQSQIGQVNPSYSIGGFWCWRFVNYVGDTSGAPGYSDVQAPGAFAEPVDPSGPQPGDIVEYGDPTQHNQVIHVGIVESVGSSSFVSIEGNSFASSTTVVENTRPLSGPGPDGLDPVAFLTP